MREKEKERVCVCAGVRVRVRACVCESEVVSVWVGGWAYSCVFTHFTHFSCVRACVRVYMCMFTQFTHFRYEIDPFESKDEYWREVCMCM